MKLQDYHTHNGYSGCASKYPYSVAEGWKTIQQRGVTKWGLSNHYPSQKIYGNFIPILRAEIDAMENDNILLGVELELSSEEGNWDLKRDQLNHLDYVIGSVHNQPHGFLTLPDITAEEIDEFFESFRNLLVNNFEKNPIQIWGHPFMNEFERFGAKYWQYHLRPIFEAMLPILAKRHIAIDINPSYESKCKKFPEVAGVLDDLFSLATDNPDVYFVTSSDAHSLANLGDLSFALSLVEKYEIPERRILEINKKM